MKRSTLISFAAVLALLGLADASYLAEAALTGGQLACSIGGLSNCNIVAQSPYSHVLGIPLGVYGVVFYGLFLIASLVALWRASRRMDRLLAALAAVGLVASLWFVYIQVALIRAVCIYCLGSALVALLLCVPAGALLMRQEPPLSAPSQT